QDLPNGFVLQAQFAPISDRNFLEQYFKAEFDTADNQETSLYVKQTQGSWAWTGLVEPRLNNFVTETEWLPRADGYLIGASFFDLLSYTSHLSAGYGQLRTATQTLPQVSPTDVNIDTGRFDYSQELSAPF